MKKAVVFISKGKGFSSWLIRFFTTQLLRKDAMVAARVSLVCSWGCLFRALFGFGKFSKVRATYNHAFIGYHSEDFHKLFAVDIREDGPIPQALSVALKKCSYIQVFEPTYDLFTGVRKQVLKIDSGYDWLALAGAILVICWYLLTGYRAKRMPHSPKRNFCSEYVVSVINTSTGATPLGEPSAVYPQLLSSLLEDSSEYNLLYEGPVQSFCSSGL